MTEVHIEQAVLSEGTVLIYKDYKTYVRMAYDPIRISEAGALETLHSYLPRLGVNDRTVHHAEV